MAWLIQVEHMEEKELRDFEQQLNAKPGVQLSRGVPELMKIMGGGGRRSR